MFGKKRYVILSIAGYVAMLSISMNLEVSSTGIIYTNTILICNTEVCLERRDMLSYLSTGYVAMLSISMNLEVSS